MGDNIFISLLHISFSFFSFIFLGYKCFNGEEKKKYKRKLV
jgi:hypothetical protein